MRRAIGVHQGREARQFDCVDADAGVFHAGEDAGQGQLDVFVEGAQVAAVDFGPKSLVEFVDEEGAFIGAGSGAQVEAALDQGFERAGGRVGIEQKRVERNVVAEAGGLDAPLDEIAASGISDRRRLWEARGLRDAAEFCEARGGQAAGFARGGRPGRIRHRSDERRRRAGAGGDAPR